MVDIRLMLVDDHDIVRTGLKSFLESQADFVIVGEARNGYEAVERGIELVPDVIIMDITMPEMDGFEATRQLNSRCPQCRILVLTVHEDKEYFFQMLEAGASGYISKRSASEELISAIRTVNAGNVYLQPALASWLLDDYRRLLDGSLSIKISLSSDAVDQAEVGLEELSKRELQVLELVADGMTTPEIAKRLELSPKTISRHRERIMNKLHLHTIADLVKFAIRNGLIEI